MSGWVVSLSWTVAQAAPDGQIEERVRWWHPAEPQTYPTAVEAARFALDLVRESQAKGVYWPEPVGYAVHRLGEEPAGAGIVWDDETAADKTAESIAAAIEEANR